LHLAVLGGFSVEGADGRPVSITSKKNRALLAILALSPQLSAPRDSLANLLWSDRDDAHARSSLRQSLVLLRRELGKATLAAMVIGDETISLASDRVEIDALEFLRLAEATDAASLRRAAELYRGELLSGLSISDAAFDDWVISERARFSETAVRALDRLVPLETGPAETAAAQRLLVLDPLRETSHRLLMQAYAHTGDKGLALKQFEICKDLLRKELNAEPAHETLELRKQIASSSIEGLPTKQSSSSSLPLPDKPSIAVMPFHNLSGDPKQEYFADGVVEEIITALSRFRQLFVIARNSSFTYKGRAVDVKLVGRELGVRYVLEGSVRRAGNRLRITGQLIDTSTGAHLWADRFDGGLKDVFDLQDQVTANVVGAVLPKLEQAELDRSRRKPTENLDAYDCFLRGLAGLHQWTKESIDEAQSYLYRAIELDPNFASAYGVAARTYVRRKAGGWIADRDRQSAEATRLARLAADLGKDDALALVCAGITLSFIAGEHEDGKILTERALVLNPNLVLGWLYSGWTRLWLGEPEEAIERVSRAMRLSPSDPDGFSMYCAMAFAHFFAGRYSDAISWSERAAREKPDILLPVIVAAASNAQAGRSEEAKRAMSQVRRIDPALRMSNLRELFPIRRSKHFDRWAEGLRKAGLPE
jgi:TolB-like protein